jgi:hypothetical protein
MIKWVGGLVGERLERERVEAGGIGQVEEVGGSCRIHLKGCYQE